MRHFVGKMFVISPVMFLFHVVLKTKFSKRTHYCDVLPVATVPCQLS